MRVWYQIASSLAPAAVRYLARWCASRARNSYGARPDPTFFDEMSTANQAFNRIQKQSCLRQCPKDWTASIDPIF